MAKKKKGKGKKADKKPKGGISALEKAQLVSRIAELQEKINRRVECCEELEEAVFVYQNGYKRECDEKESMVKDIKQAITEVNIETKKLKDNFLLMESKQNMELRQLQTELESLGNQKQNVQEKLINEIEYMQGKYEGLVNFREETVHIMKRIEEAEEERISQAKKFQQDLETRNKTANKLLDSLKCQLVYYLKMRASALNEKFVVRPDPKYLRVIEQSLGLEDTVTALSEWMEQLEDENNSLKAKAADMRQQHDIMRKNRYERVAQEQELREFTSLLRAQTELHFQQTQTAEKRSQQIERTRQCITLLELKIQNLKLKHAQMKKEWEEREADVRKSEAKRLIEQELHIQIRKAIRYIHKSVKREADRQLKKSYEGKSLEMILNEMFSCTLKPVAENDGYLYVDEETSEICSAQGYHPGSAGILFKKQYVNDAKVHHKEEYKKNSIQTKNSSHILPPTVDIISANLLSEVGLLRKFDVAKRK